MTLTDSDIETIRRIVRQEIRREHEGVRCPRCDKQMPTGIWDCSDFDEDSVFTCTCGYEAHPHEYINAKPVLDEYGPGETFSP